MVPIYFRDLSHFIPLEFYISLSSPPGPRDPSLSADRRGVETMETMGSAASRSSPKLGLKTLVKVWATGRLWYLLISYGHFQWTGYDILWYLMVISVKEICHGLMQYWREHLGKIQQIVGEDHCFELQDFIQPVFFGLQHGFRVLDTTHVRSAARWRG